MSNNKTKCIGLQKYDSLLETGLICPHCGSRGDAEVDCNEYGKNQGTHLHKKAMRLFKTMGMYCLKCNGEWKEWYYLSSIKLSEDLKKKLSRKQLSVNEFSSKDIYERVAEATGINEDNIVSVPSFYNHKRSTSDLYLSHPVVIYDSSSDSDDKGLTNLLDNIAATEAEPEDDTPDGFITSWTEVYKFHAAEWEV